MVVEAEAEVEAERHRHAVAGERRKAEIVRLNERTLQELTKNCKICEGQGEGGVQWRG